MLARTNGRQGRDIEHEELINGRFGPFARLGKNNAYFLLPQTYGAVADVAAQSKNSLASIATFVWAVRFLTLPARIALPRLIGSRRQDYHKNLPELTYGGPFGSISLFSADISEPIRELTQILTNLTQQGPSNKILASVFPDDRSQEIVKAFSELTSGARDVVQRLLQSGSVRPSLNPITAAEAKGFMTRFTEIFQKDTPDPTIPPKENSASDINEIETLSHLARQAVSQDLDGATPYYKKNEQIPAIAIALTAAEADGYITPNQICEELIEAGYQVASADDWELLATVAGRLLSIGFKNGISRRDGRFGLGSDLDELLEKYRGTDLDQVIQVAALLDEAGFASDSTTRIAQLGKLRRSDLWDLVEILDDEFPVTADIVSLVRLADLKSISLGESLAILTEYRPLIDPNWRLPDRLSQETAERGRPRLNGQLPLHRCHRSSAVARNSRAGVGAVGRAPRGAL